MQRERHDLHPKSEEETMRHVTSGSVVMGLATDGQWVGRPTYEESLRTTGWLATGLLILPAFAVIFVRYFVKESAVWVENQRLQREQKREVRAPLLQIFKRGLIGNTLTACWWMTSAFVIYYSIWSLFRTHLQKPLNFCPTQAAIPIM